MPISSGTGILPVQRSRHDKSHGQDARATGVAPIDPSGPASLSWRQTTTACSRYVFIETALGRGGRRFISFGAWASSLEDRGRLADRSAFADHTEVNDALPGALGVNG